MCTKDDLAKLKAVFQKSDVIESWSRKRMKSKWKVSKLTKCLLHYWKTFLWVVRTLFYPNFCIKITQTTLSCKTSIQNTHNGTTCVFLVLLLSLHTEINDWKKQFQNSSICSKMEGVVSVQFQVAHKKDLWVVEELITLSFLL